MSFSEERFNLKAALDALSQGLLAVICHIVFDAAWHGLAFALILGIAGFILRKRQHRFGVPLIVVCRKLSIFCLILMVPGALALALSGHLPSTGTFQISSLGFIVFWTLISLHLSAEEMNYEWFQKN